MDNLSGRRELRTSWGALLVCGANNAKVNNYLATEKMMSRSW